MGQFDPTKGKQALEIRSSLSERRALTDPILPGDSADLAHTLSRQWAKAHGEIQTLSLWILDFSFAVNLMCNNEKLAGAFAGVPQGSTFVPLDYFFHVNWRVIMYCKNAANITCCLVSCLFLPHLHVVVVVFLPLQQFRCYFHLLIKFI